MPASNSPPPSGWSVGAIVREPPEVLRRFVAWHLDAGAEGVHLCFDDPDDPAFDAFARMPRVRAERCTPAFWDALGIAPGAEFVKRQNRAMQFAYEACPTPWFLGIDADELMMATAASIAALLAALPPSTRTLCVEPAERVSVPDLPGRQLFRRRLARRHLMRFLSDEDRSAVQRRGGMAGHRAGKSFVRTGLDLQIRQHFPQLDGKPVIDASYGPEDGLVLLHFLSLDYAVWRDKLPVRLTRGAFINRLRPRVEAALAAGDEAAVRTVFALLFELDGATAGWLKRKGRVIEPEVDVDAAVRRWFPEAAPNRPQAAEGNQVATFSSSPRSGVSSRRAARSNRA